MLQYCSSQKKKKNPKYHKNVIDLFNSLGIDVSRIKIEATVVNKGLQIITSKLLLFQKLVEGREGGK